MVDSFSAGGRCVAVDPKTDKGSRSVASVSTGRS